MTWDFLVRPPIRGTTFSPEAATLPRNVLLYWRPDTVEHHLDSLKLYFIVASFLPESCFYEQVGERIYDLTNRM